VVLKEEFVKELKDSFAHPSVFDYKEKEGDILEITAFQLTHSKGPIPFRGGEKNTLFLGKGKDGRDTYICVEGKRFLVNKRDFKDITKENVFARDNVLKLEDSQLQILRDNIDKLEVNNISESKIEALRGDEFKEDLMPLHEK